MLLPFRDLRKRGSNPVDRILEKEFEKRGCQIFQRNDVVGQFPICRPHGQVVNFLEWDFWGVRGDFTCSVSAVVSMGRRNTQLEPTLH
jgi:hypothetical protein